MIQMHFILVLVKKNFSSDVMFREFFDVKHQILLSVKIFATFIYFVSEFK